MGCDNAQGHYSTPGSAPPEAIRTSLGLATGRLYAPSSFKGATPEHPGALEGLPLATLRRTFDDQTVTLSRKNDEKQISMALRVVANDVRPVIEIAEPCGILALLPDFAAPPDCTLVLGEWSGNPIEINAVRAPSRGAFSKVQALIKVLQIGVRNRTSSLS